MSQDYCWSKKATLAALRLDQLLRMKPLTHLPHDPCRVVERNVVAGVGMTSEVGFPKSGEPARTPLIDQAIAFAGEDEHVHGRLACGGVVSACGPQLAYCIGRCHGVIAPQRNSAASRE